MPADLNISKTSGIAFLVSAGIVYEIIAAACSSPQTTEINAATRADTLMKWVNIGCVQAAVFVIAAAFLDKAAMWAYLGGGMLAMIMMYLSYMHAKAAGLSSNLPGTES